ncbi:phosphoglycolate phosphatase [Lutibacter oricola]|uniref:phosphoglycolate phosphatase n=1 Tax=Lutibacter oricola TaxID=762486 RepID=A0A1H2W4W9_9FLAO|nr:HAD hydrolase-like protein [Lutibacter oricola]SDW75712.1 phosphoglycolate phosphatase [Lutibacter oricola]
MSILNSYNNVIWDWNGTLLNDVQLCIEIVNDFLKIQNKTTLTIDSYKNAFDFPIIEYYKSVGLEFDEASFEELTHKFIYKYNSNVMKQPLHNHVLKVLDYCKTNNKTQYILTAANEKDVLKFINKFNITPYFKHITGLTNYRAESKTAIGIELMKQQQISTNSTVLIGDTTHDFEVAEQLNIDCILIANGHQNKERLERKSSKNTIVVSSLKELLYVQ